MTGHISFRPQRLLSLCLHWLFFKHTTTIIENKFILPADIVCLGCSALESDIVNKRTSCFPTHPTLRTGEGYETLTGWRRQSCVWTKTKIDIQSHEGLRIHRPDLSSNKGVGISRCRFLPTFAKDPSEEEQLLCKNTSKPKGCTTTNDSKTIPWHFAALRQNIILSCT